MTLAPISRRPAGPLCVDHITADGGWQVTVMKYPYHTRSFTKKSRLIFGRKSGSPYHCTWHIELKGAHDMGSKLSAVKKGDLVAYDAEDDLDTGRVVDVLAMKGTDVREVHIQWDSTGEVLVNATDDGMLRIIDTKERRRLRPQMLDTRKRYDKESEEVIVTKANSKRKVVSRSFTCMGYSCAALARWAGKRWASATGAEIYETMKLLGWKNEITSARHVIVGSVADGRAGRHGAPAPVSTDDAKVFGTKLATVKKSMKDAAKAAQKQKDADARPATGSPKKGTVAQAAKAAGVAK